MNKKLFVLAAFCAVFVCSVSGAEKSNVMPKFTDSNTIVCGNKKVVLSADGKVSIANASGEIVNVSLQYIFKESANGKVDWFTVTPAICKMSQDGNKVVWELWKKHALHTWKVADQTLEILEDGQMKLTAQIFNPETDKIVPRLPNASFFIFFPVAKNEGRKMLFNGQEYTLAAGVKGVSAWRGTQFDYELFPGDQADNIIFKSSKIYQTASIIVGPNHRITYLFPKDGCGEILIDLRK